MNRIIPLLLIVVSIFLPFSRAGAQTDTTKLDGLKFRSLGPATFSGRIADIAIDPADESTWYVAVGSGGVWKTENNGTTWKPVFDHEGSYSIGCVTIDPVDPATVWVGTGENVGGRHVGFGDGVYVSHDGGKNWKNAGLKDSEHISKIIVHPENPDTVWVAAQGPLWSKGGERGLYKTTDGGKTWKKTLGNDEWTGVTDIELDPNNPDILYAATWDRHRTVAAYVGGGPGTGIYKSTDGGETWKELTEGIPESNMGKIGLAISPFDSNTIFAAIELDRKKGGVFMSTDQGATWTKQSDTVSGGTGPHYYQELYASPHQEGRLYLMNNYALISDDYGKTFTQMNEDKKHVDNHAMAFKASDPNFVLFGTDGGLYESYDLTKTWRYIPNLPVMQFYMIGVDDAKPFYHIYGGTQDNGSLGGPSQTFAKDGILNSDWWKTLGADGYESATIPGHPDLTYGEYQQGVLFRIDQKTRETVYIQPQPGPGDPYERFNWNAPILVSSHSPSRVYFGSYRVWKSDNYGDSWEAISGDLTRNEERLTLPIMGKQPSWDNAWDVYAMSDYNTITAMTESPVRDGILYAGTDDGLLQVTEDGGANWRKIALGNIRGVPDRAFVNDVRADLFDAQTVYLAVDNHKEGDFKPYLLKSTDMGKTWTSITGNLPKRTIVWKLVQDSIKKDLLFAATEFGVYMTHDGGSTWTQLKGGMPTIAFRDIKIQKDEDDLVAASFGRGIYILDDISPLRDFSVKSPPQEATLYPVKTAELFIPQEVPDGHGNTQYLGENPPFGAVFTYYLPEKLKSIREERREREKTLKENKANLPFPGWESLEQETNQEHPEIVLTVKDPGGKVVNIIKGSNKKGFNRTAWDLTYASREGVPLKKKSEEEDEEEGWNHRNYYVNPGSFSVTLSSLVDGKLTQLDGPKSLQVKKIQTGTLSPQTDETIAAFRQRFQEFQQDLLAVNTSLEKGLSTVRAMETALKQAPSPSADLFMQIEDARDALLELKNVMHGNPAKNQIGEDNPPSPQEAVTVGSRVLSTTYGPTPNHLKALSRAEQQLNGVEGRLQALTQQTLPQLEAALKKAGAPWIEGEGLRE